MSKESTHLLHIIQPLVSLSSHFLKLFSFVFLCIIIISGLCVIAYVAKQSCFVTLEQSDIAREQYENRYVLNDFLSDLITTSFFEELLTLVCVNAQGGRGGPFLDISKATS